MVGVTCANRFVAVVKLTVSGMTEEQIVHLFGTVGTVVNFRLVYDKETGKPKGFGFMEFADLDASASAVRNLNDHEVLNRRLKVDYSNEGTAHDSGSTNTAVLHMQHLPSVQDGQQGRLPPLPAGADLPPNFTCADAISRTLYTLPAPQLLDILSQMKGLVAQDPDKATELLSKAPQLAYAIFQALLLLGLVDTNVLGTIVDQAQRPPVQQAAQPPALSHFPPQLPTATTPYQQAPLHHAPYQQPPYAQPSYTQPPYPQPPYPQPPYQQPSYQQPAPQPAPQQDPQALIRRVLMMPQHQIDALPALERAQIEALRRQFAGQAF